MSAAGGLHGTPGVDAIRESHEVSPLWSTEGVVRIPFPIVDGSARDATNTPTTHLRAGLLLAKETSSGQYTEWDADATDGSQDLAGVLGGDVSVIDNDGADLDRNPWIIARALLRTSALRIQGTLLTSHADEFLARRQLFQMGCMLDDDIQGFKSGLVPRYDRVTGTTDTLTEAETGKQIWYSNAASTTVTLPTIHAGLRYILLREGDEEFVITSAEGDNIIAGNDLSADSITFTTASEHIGAGVEIEGIYLNGTLKWLPRIVPVPFGTDLSGLTYAVAT